MQIVAQTCNLAKGDMNLKQFLHNHHDIGLGFVELQNQLEVTTLT